MDLLFRSRNWFGKHDSCDWNLYPLCLMWTLWTARNSRAFEDKAITTDHLKGAFINSLFDWVRVWELTITTLVTNFVLSVIIPLLLICCNFSPLNVHPLCT